MPSKRRNNGRKKTNAGHTRPISCTHCARMVPKDKAINKFTVKDIIEGSSKDDLNAAQHYDEFAIPKVYQKMSYCISCGIHSRIVRVRSRENRRIRNTRKPNDKLEKKPKEQKDEKVKAA